MFSTKLHFQRNKIKILRIERAYNLFIKLQFTVVEDWKFIHEKQSVKRLQTHALRGNNSKAKKTAQNKNKNKKWRYT